MEYIVHRVNSLKKLDKLSHKYGVEIDIRNDEEDLFLQHDPFKKGESFENFIKEYKHGTIILNIKSERIEYRVLETLRKYNVSDYFFLDSSIPMIQLLSKININKIAIRYSDYESVETVFNMRKKVKWVWVDCFKGELIKVGDYKKLKKMGLKLCLVSPELQMFDVSRIKTFAQKMKKRNIYFHAVCTKYPNIWKDNLK